MFDEWAINRITKDFLFENDRIYCAVHRTYKVKSISNRRYHQIYDCLSLYNVNAQEHEMGHQGKKGILLTSTL